MEFSHTALVLKVGRFKEIDQWVRLLSPDRGVYTAFAFGGCVSRRRFCGCLDPFNLIQVRVTSDSRGRYLQLGESRLERSFPRVRTEPERMGAAVNCLKFVEACEPAQDSAAGAYQLLCDALEVLEASETPPQGLPVFFRMRLAFELGFGPDLGTCHRCGRAVLEEASPRSGPHVSPRIVVEEGTVTCSRCASRTGFAVRPETLQALGDLAASRPAQWSGLHLSAQVRGQCYEIVERFIEYHLGLGWQGGRYQRR